MKAITIDELSQKAIHRYGIDLYDVENAMLLIKLCQQANIPVLGIDAFRLYGDKIQPCMENSIDLSFENGNYDLALQFLADRRTAGFLYEIVY